MFALRNSIASLAIAPRHQAAARAIVTLAVASLVTSSTACNTADAAPRGEQRIYAAAQRLGAGTARTYLALDARGKPRSLGVALSESALRDLPQHPMEGMPSAAMLVLPLPAEAARTGFDHVMLDWNPEGHEPDHVYTRPHFDFHFYQISSAERQSIMPSNPAWEKKVSHFPSADYVPQGYAAVSSLAGIPASKAGVPLMGMHWLDVEAPELREPPIGKPFTATFIYGTWDGKMIFAEPMITKAYLESVKQLEGGVRFPVGTAKKVAKPGAYPTAYSIVYDAVAKEYRVSLDGLVERQ